MDASLDDDDEYEARVLFKGVKIVTGKGMTRQSALMKAFEELNILEAKINNETYERRRGIRDRKKRTD